VLDPVAGELRILLVQGDRPAAELLVLERPAKNAGAADRQAVVAEAERAGLADRGHLGQLCALHAPGDRGEEADRDACRFARRLAQRLDVGGGRDRRFGVGHRDDAAVAAGGGGPAAGLEVLLVLLPGGSQVDVRVEEGGEGVQSLGVDLLQPLDLGAGRGQLGDPAGADDDVVDAVDPGDRIEHGGGAQDQVRALAGAHVERLGQLHAGCPIGVGRCSGSPTAAGGRSFPVLARSS
jgi:hypothetical protein